MGLVSGCFVEEHLPVNLVTVGAWMVESLSEGRATRNVPYGNVTVFWLY